MPRERTKNTVSVADWNRYYRYVGGTNIAQAAAGVFVDLDGDGTDEFVLLSGAGGPAYKESGRHWEDFGLLYFDGSRPVWSILMKALTGRQVAGVPHPWKDLLVGDHRYRMQQFGR